MHIVKSLKETYDVMALLGTDETLHRIIDKISDVCCNAINNGGKIMLAGNGG